MSQRIKLPNNRLAILDTSILINAVNSPKDPKDLLSNWLTNYSENLKYYISYLKGKENWITVPEVVREVERGIKIFERKHHEVIRSNPKSKIKFRKSGYDSRKLQKNKAVKAGFKKLLKQTNHLVNLVSERAIDFNSDLSQKQRDIFCYTLPQIEEIYKVTQQTPNKLNTDCRLISLAITYGIEDKIAVGSNDKGQSIAFVHHALEKYPQLYKNFSIINTNLGNINCKDYYKYVTRGLSQRAHPNLPLIILDSEGSKPQDSVILQSA